MRPLPFRVGVRFDARDWRVGALWIPETSLLWLHLPCLVISVQGESARREAWEACSRARLATVLNHQVAKAGESYSYSTAKHSRRPASDVRAGRTCGTVAERAYDPISATEDFSAAADPDDIPAQLRLIRMELLDKIKAAISNGEISQTRLAELSGLRQGTVWNLVHDRVSPTLRTLQKLERGYRLHLEEQRTGSAEKAEGAR